MDIKGVRAMPDYMKRKCPFCHRELGMAEVLKRKATKMCKCKCCGKIIDERYINY